MGQHHAFVLKYRVLGYDENYYSLGGYLVGFEREPSEPEKAEKRNNDRPFCLSATT